MEDYCTLKIDIKSDLQFQKISFDDKNMLEQAFATYPSRSCDFSVGGILMWADLFDYEYAYAEDSLLLMGKFPNNGSTFFHWPLGDMSEDKFLNLVRDYCCSKKISDAVILKPEEVAAENADEYDSHPETFARGWKEYLYNIDKFTHFSGRKMEKKRNHLNYFFSHYDDISTELISSENAKELLAFTLEFEAEHGDSELSDYENNQVSEALVNYTDLPYFGIVLRAGGKIVGFSFGECIGDTFIIHVEKADTYYKGSYQAVASELAKAVLTHFPETVYLNREDDMGVENLRQSKESYHPSLYICKQIIKVGNS